MSADEFNSFQRIPYKTRIDCMTLYLIGDNGRTFNMQDIGEMVFGDKNASFTVSLIHRMYNFEGKNGGKYKNGCKFEKTYGYRITRQDIERFVYAYPNGCKDSSVTFEQFLISNLNQRNNNVQNGYNQEAVQQYTYQNNQNYSNEYDHATEQMIQHLTNNTANESNNTTETQLSGGDEVFVIIVGLIVGAVLLYLIYRFFKFIILWTISFIMNYWLLIVLGIAIIFIIKYIINRIRY